MQWTHTPLVTFVASLLIFAVPGSAIAFDAVEPADGAPLRLDQPTEFSSTSCPPDGTLVSGATLLMSRDGQVDAYGVFTQRDYVQKSPASDGDIRLFIYDPRYKAYEDLPPDGSTYYWQIACYRFSAGGYREATVPRSLAVTLGSRFAPPSSSEIGLSVEKGALFTNNPHVKITVAAPEFSTEIRVANDGGFAESQTFPVPPNYRQTYN
jgi:hypothetical protein